MWDGRLHQSSLCRRGNFRPERLLRKKFCVMDLGIEELLDLDLAERSPVLLRRGHAGGEGRVPWVAVLWRMHGKAVLGAWLIEGGLALVGAGW